MTLVTKTATAKVDDSLTYVMSDGTKDRMGDVIEPDGWRLDNFRRNPIALFGHNGGFPIGSWRDVRVEKGELKGRLELLPKGTSARLDEIRAAVDAGVLRAVSVGFRANKTEPLNKEGGIRFLEHELLECSLVTIPANPNSLQQMRGLGLSADAISTVFGEHADTTPGAMLRRSPGEHAETRSRAASSPRIRAKAMPQMTLSQRVEDAQKAWTAAQDELLEHLNELEDNALPTDADLAVRDELNGRVASAKKNYDSLVQAEQTLARRSEPVPSSEIAAPAIRRGFIQPAKIREGQHYMNVLTAMALCITKGWRPRLDRPEVFFETLAEMHGQDGRIDERTRAVAAMCMRGESERCLPAEVFQRAMSPNFMTTRAATAPATTTTSGWASQLVQTGYADFLDLLLPASVFPGLAARAMRLTFGRNGVISIPSRLSTPTIAGAFVAEGAAIPVKQAAVTSTTLTPKKMGVISGFTREIAEHSTPAIETLIRQWMQEDTSVSLDAILLDSNPATSIRPAGILNGVAAITATAGGGFAALVGDIKALIGALLTATNNNLRRPVWLMNPAQQIAIALTQNAGGDFPFAAEINNNSFMNYPVIVSGNIPAKTVIVLDAADFAVVEAGAPRFDISDQAVLHFEDSAPAQIGTVGSPNVVAAPARSLWQTDSMAIRMILDVNWTFVRTGSIAWTQNVTW